jgi:hypothetical protein
MGCTKVVSVTKGVQKKKGLQQFLSGQLNWAEQYEWPSKSKFHFDYAINYTEYSFECKIWTDQRSNFFQLWMFFFLLSKSYFEKV